MKHILLTAAMMMVAISSAAQTLSQQQVYQNSLEQAAIITDKQNPHLQLVAIPDVEHLYVYNIAGGGFIVASGDARALPILGYSTTGAVDPGNMPPNLRNWLALYEEQLKEIEASGVTVLPETSLQSKDGLPDSVPALITSEWNQYRYGYNSQVPYDSTYANDSTMARFDNHPTVGCAALAMGQIMRYWQFPQHGYGTSHYDLSQSSECWHYGTVSADFANTTYNYALMPDKLSTSSTEQEVDAVAKLLAHCGVASMMKYNSDCQGSSGTTITNSAIGLQRFFHYNTDYTIGYARYIGESNWRQMLKTDLAAGRPIFYTAVSAAHGEEGIVEGGHAFILDGYNNEDYFHINWGWNGTGNGYYSLSALRPTPQFNFCESHSAILNLHPDTNARGEIAQASDLSMSAPCFTTDSRLSGSYKVTNIGDGVADLYMGVNIYTLRGQFMGCVDGRHLHLLPGDTAVCRFSYPLSLQPDCYQAVMQYSDQPLYAGMNEDISLMHYDLTYNSYITFDVVEGPIDQTLTNLVIFVRFADDYEIFYSFPRIDSMFNTSEGSVAKFFEASSYGHIHFNTVFANQVYDSRIISYVDTMPRGYFRPYSEDNPIGYTIPNPKRGISMREAELIDRVMRYVDQHHLVDSTVNLDGNGDGKIDNVSLIIKGGLDGWGELLWPHMEFFPHDSVGHIVTINGKRLDAFNFEFEGSGPNSFCVQTFCHEMGHSLGLPDLYHYHNWTGHTPVPWDIMGKTMMQHSAIYKYKFMHVCDAPRQITQDGTYTINSVGSSESNNLYYIKSAIDSNQWFTIEYRDYNDPFEKIINTRTLLMGRWMDTVPIDYHFGGNAEFDFFTRPNAYYTFRSRSRIDTLDGHLGTFFNNVFGRTYFGPSSDPHPFLADGTPETSFEIYDISENGNTCTFSVRFLNQGIEPSSTSLNAFTLYPNPAHGQVTIEPDNPIQPYSVAIFNTLGKQVWHTEGAKGKVLFDTQNLPGGVYYVTFTSQNKSTTTKLTVE